MKAATLREIKKELSLHSHENLQELCLRLTRFKKENKELLTYLLFESTNEEAYINSIRRYVENEFELINRSSLFYIRKSVRKILRNLKKYIRYSQKKETEVELLLHFCEQLKAFRPNIKRSQQLVNTYTRQIALIKKTVTTLHEDLQYDYNLKLEELNH
ncbi:hypothetical protein [Aestuariivivens sp. NBU2969]|uniref:hypothetical protein n=1 Tax=Aestuariivivens sp. NBU2969 TaxID=2873267 RepID=UPI001CBF3C25|nr:hypothetical protein [Aestuariivivens sp. NBU2969]